MNVITSFTFYSLFTTLLLVILLSTCINSYRVIKVSFPENDKFSNGKTGSRKTQDTTNENAFPVYTDINDLSTNEVESKNLHKQNADRVFLELLKLNNPRENETTNSNNESKQHSRVR